MIVKFYINARGLKFKDSTGSRPMRMTLSTTETKDRYSELDITNMTMKERKESVLLYEREAMEKGLLAGGAGKYIDPPIDVVIENDNIVIKNIPKADVRPDVHISGKGLTTYQLGKLIAENKIRGLDSDPSMREKVYENEVWDKDAVERIRTWVTEVKLPNTPVEWQYLNRLEKDDKDREINKIVNAIIYNKYTGVFVKNKMRNKESKAYKKYEKALNEFADQRKYEQTINAARRMNFK